MRHLEVHMHGIKAGILEEREPGKHYCFTYDPEYSGPPISLTLPKQAALYDFNSFPPFFDGLLPEGFQLEALLKISKIDRSDYMTQLLTVGEDLVGAITVCLCDGQR